MRGVTSHLCNLFCKDYWACKVHGEKEVYKELIQEGELEKINYSTKRFVRTLRESPNEKSSDEYFNHSQKKRV